MSSYGLQPGSAPVHVLNLVRCAIFSSLALSALLVSVHSHDVVAFGAHPSASHSLVRSLARSLASSLISLLIP